MKKLSSMIVWSTAALRTLATCFVLCLVALWPATAGADSLKITARAFIPSSVGDNPGYVIKIPGDGSGIRSPNPLETDICFQGDDRDFSSADSASGRWTAKAEVNLFAVGGSNYKSKSGVTQPTHAIACSDAKTICTLQASNDAMSWGPISDALLTTFNLDAEAGNPCIWPQTITPNIKLHGQLSISPIDGQIKFSGTGSTFPSIEIYYQYEAFPAQPLVHSAASGSVFKIGTQKAISGDAKLPIFEGGWSSSDAANRFKIVVSGDTCKFVERSASGTTLERSGKIALGPDGLLRIERPNDIQVLRFLGFAENIIPDILAHSPQPSFLRVKRDSTGIAAEWAGLLVIKDAQGHFKELKQPGQGPIKPYALQR